jgi:hypothetical protein
MGIFLLNTQGHLSGIRIIGRGRGKLAVGRGRQTGIRIDLPIEERSITEQSPNLPVSYCRIDPITAPGQQEDPYEKKHPTQWEGFHGSAFQEG